MLKRLFHPPGEHGQGLVEYALILMLVAIIVIIILIVFGDSVRELYCDITEALDPYFNINNPGVCDTEAETEGALNVIPAVIIASFISIF